MPALHALRLAAIRRVISGSSSLEAEATALGVSPSTLQAWIDFALDDAGARASRRRLAWLGAAAVAFAGVAVLVSSPSFAQSCGETLPAPLVPFCPNQPAMATTVNDNFRILANAIIARTGNLNAVDAGFVGVVVSASTNSTLGAVTPNNTAVLENRDNGGNARLELRSTGTPYIDFINDGTADYDARIRLNSNGTLEVVAPDFVTPCPSGYIGISSGRLCVGALEAAAIGHTAIDTCRTKTPASHVCSHAELQQACPTLGGMGSATGWYGDITGDDAMMTWNQAICDPNNTGAPASALSGTSLRYRCCL